MSHSIQEYYALLARWRKQYGVPPPPRQFGLTTFTSACVKNGCGSLKRIQRHHTGNDLWFAILLPDHYAARYVQFHKDDVAYLCEHHHKSVHKLYKSLMDDVWAELNEGGQTIITKEWADKWIAKFRKKFNRWKNVPARKRKKKRKHL